MDNEITQEASVFDGQMNYTYATTGQRFLNFIIDMIIGYIVVYAVILVLALTIPPFREFAISLNDGSVGSMLMDRLLTILLLALVFTVIEGASKGRTLGKLITGTKAVNDDDLQPISWKQAFQR